MPRKKWSVTCSHWRILTPQMYSGTISPSEREEAIQVKKIQETGSSKVSMQSSLQYAYPDTGPLLTNMPTLKLDESIVCRHCRIRYPITQYTKAIRCYACGDIISIQEQENISRGTSTHSRAESVIDPISTWEAKNGKRALLCGVTYNKEKFKLRGTTNDVMNMRDLLVDHFEFPRSSIRILAETESHHHPTKRNIQEAMRWLLKDCQAGDSLVFYFSGHGLRQPDFGNDEFNETIVRPLKKGVILHAIVDAFQSGTILDLPHVYGSKVKRWLDNSPPSGTYKGTSGGLAISLAACEDDRLAYSSSDSRKQMQGAIISSFVKAVKENPKLTYSGLLDSMRKARNEQYCSFSLTQAFTQGYKRQGQQDIMLSSSEIFDTNNTFRL